MRQTRTSESAAFALVTESVILKLNQDRRYNAAPAATTGEWHINHPQSQAVRRRPTC
jgi:hypothetical protein